MFSQLVIVNNRTKKQCAFPIDNEIHKRVRVLKYFNLHFELFSNRLK